MSFKVVADVGSDLIVSFRIAIVLISESSVLPVNLDAQTLGPSRPTETDSSLYTKSMSGHSKSYSSKD